jgi:GTPase SAR1 family protein
LIVPGTTISLTLLPSYIEVRDKGIIKKKIPLKGRSFRDMQDELLKYFLFLGKRLPPGILKDTMIRIGVPETRAVVMEEEPEPQPEAPPVIETRVKEEPVAATFIKSPEIEPPEIEVVSMSSHDFKDITEALSVVESMSDSFMAASAKQSKKMDKAQGIRISLRGSEVVEAAAGTHSTTPAIIPSNSLTEEVISTPDSEEPIDLEALKIAEEQSSEPEITWAQAPEEKAPKTVATPKHVITPIVIAKVIILGEDGVGKGSLLEKAGLEFMIEEKEPESPQTIQYIHERLFELVDYRVMLRVWSFDEAVRMDIARREFYEAADALIIVYSASDRWSFQSLEFWLKEASSTIESLPPIIIVGNKTDLRSESDEDAEEPPISRDEGFVFAEELAKKLGEDGRLHPVAFLETSCLTGEGVEDVFKTASQLYVKGL